MCGIAGIVDVARRLGRSKLKALATHMADRMIHRGPDDSGVWVEDDGSCVFAHRRLSIIDTSSAGRQPLFSTDGRAVITFNGELYNFRELRVALAARGCHFSTRTDTEVLLEAVRTYGDDAYIQLDGMYAFALLDRDSREITLARDPFGEKPLYYTCQNGYFAFASELHCLTLLPDFNRTLDEEAIAQYFIFQYVPAPRTIYRSVSKLPPGHVLHLDPHGSFRITRYFRFEPLADPGAPQRIDDLADELEEILIQSIRRRMISDVPLGAFLSGGVDSSTVVALMSKALGQRVKTFSIGFDGTAESEHIFARDMAQQLGTEHHERILRPDALALVELVGRALDEPNSDSSCLPTYLLSQFAREKVTVALSGDGGDEMFGGYGRYFLTLDEARAHGKRYDAGASYFSSRILIFTDADLEALLGHVPPETRDLLNELRSEINTTPIPLLSRLRAVDMRTYLPGAVLAKVDRMSMQHALEVRSPILSIDVARFAERLAPENCYQDGSGKLVLKRILQRYAPRKWVERQKQGFGLPTQLWAQTELLEQLRRLCLGDGSICHRWLGRKNIECFIDRQGDPVTFATYQVWALLILEVWLRHHEGRDSSPIGRFVRNLFPASRVSSQVLKLPTSVVNG